MAAQPTTPTTNEPTAYTARIVATGMATAAGAVLTSVIDSRGTLVGAVLVAMAVSAIGQAMRRPLDRLERRIKALGVGRGILIIAALGFTIGAGAVAAHEILRDGQVSARIARKLQASAPQERVSAVPADTAPDPVRDDEDAKTHEKPASPAAPDASKQHSAQPASAPTPTPEPASAAARP